MNTQQLLVAVTTNEIYSFLADYCFIMILSVISDTIGEK